MSKLQKIMKFYEIQICSPPQKKLVAPKRIIKKHRKTTERQKIAALEVGVLAPVDNLALAELSSGGNLICSNLLSHLVYVTID